MQRRSWKGILVAGSCLASLAGCSGGGGGGGGASNMERLGKAWQLESGDFFDRYVSEAGAVRWLLLEENGSGEMLSRRPQSGAIGCGRVHFHALDDEILSLELGLYGG